MIRFEKLVENATDMLEESKRGVKSPEAYTVRYVRHWR